MGCGAGNLPAKHVIFHAESKQDEASGFMSRLATHFAEVNNIDAPSEVSELGLGMPAVS